MTEPWSERLRRWRSVLTRTRVERELDEEIRFHLDEQAARYVAQGMDPGEARRRAHVAFGGVEHVKEQARDEFRPVVLEDLVRDLRYGARVLCRARAFAGVAIVTLGLGIGAATAVFSVVEGVLLRPLPYPDPDRIVRLFQIDATGRRNNTVSEPNFADWKARTRSFQAMAQASAGSVPVGFGADTAMTAGAVVSHEFFAVMGLAPAVGRAFRDDETRHGAAATVIVGYRLWQTRLGGAPLETLTLRIDEAMHQVVGVMPPGFDYPAASEFWTARERTPPQTSRTAHNWLVVGRLQPGVSLPAAQGELSALSRALKVTHGDQTWMSDATAVPLREQLTAASRPVLLLLFGAAVLLLLIACLNVSNLQLARASTRRREMAVRLAIGAGSARITRQLLAEALVLAAAATAVGVAIAWLGVRALAALQPGNLPRMQDITVDGTVLSFAVGLALLTAVVLGLATAARAATAEIREALSEGTRTLAGGRRSERVRQALVVAQVALTIVLLAGAGLLARSFGALLAVSPGFRTDHAQLLDLTWVYARDPAVQERRRATQQEILTRVRALPGVQQAGLVSTFPLATGNFPNGQFIEMTRADELQSFDDLARLGDEARARAGFAGYRIASAGYFAAMGIPLVRGRLFDEGDGPDAPHVAVVSESLAAAKWPGQDPLGRYVQFGNMDGDLRGFRIVGVVGDVRELSPETLPGPLFYGHYRQRLASRFTIVLGAERAGTLAAEASRAIRAIDPDLPVQARTVEEALDRALAGRRFSLTLVGVFGATALVLAALGIYGLISYLVAERTREIGIRLALGAEAGDVLHLVMGAGARLAAIGIAAGVAAALALTQLVEGMLFGITATDPVAFGAVVLLTAGAVLVASYVPARRALRVAPVTAMRMD